MKLLKKIGKVLGYSIVSLLSILLIAFLILFAKPLWHRWVTYPKAQRDLEAFQTRHREVTPVVSSKVFRGLLHLHSYWSHDSKGTLYDLVTAAKLRGIDFLFLTDHPHGSQDSFPRGFKGLYEGVLIEPGSEKEGFDSWPIRDTAVVDWKLGKDTVAKVVTQNGGIVFYAHTEEPHNWKNPYFQGMEIYNYHSNILQKKHLFPILTDFLINGSKYRAWAYRTVFDRQTSILARWDSLNTRRKVVGFGATDEHENVNFRARLLKDGRVLWTGIDTKPMDTVKVSFKNRWLFSNPDPDGYVFKWMIINTYETSFNNDVNYVFADTLSVPEMRKQLLAGHHFMAFKFLGDAKGFCYFASDKQGKTLGIMGDSIRVADIGSLKAVSPYPGKFRIVKDGKEMTSTTNESYDFSWDQPLTKGAYRLEVEVKPGKEWQPWVYTNPIYLY
ncbi:MAG: hypothetical protein LWW85_06400 [Marinilabiliales bacterium]|nr:hypothetical protein [Marinilabiliales bacterium]